MSLLQVCMVTLFGICFIPYLAQGGMNAASTDQDLLVVTVASEANDGLRQLVRSVKKNGLDIKVFGLEQNGRDSKVSATKRQKIGLLKENLRPYRSRKDLILLVVDSFDVILTGGKEAILKKFAKYDARILFGADKVCWPDSSLADKYPRVKEPEMRYLDAGGFIGYAPEICEMVDGYLSTDTVHDQVYYTHIFLNRILRHQWNIKLDTRADLFHNLNAAIDEFEIRHEGNHCYLYNLKTGATPNVIHGNKAEQPEFLRLSNYLMGGWTPTSGCLSCKEDLFDLNVLKETEYPTVLMGIFVEYPTPFIREFFQRVANLIYPKSRLQIYIHNAIELHTKDVNVFVKEHGNLYSDVIVTMPEKNVSERVAREWAMEECMRISCQYLLTLDSVVQITNPSLLTDLIIQNRSIIAPMLTRPGKLWSNFWGALDQAGFYARSVDYMDIVNYQKVGLWNVPHVFNVLLIQGHYLPVLRGAYSFNINKEPGASFCEAARTKMVFMYVNNQDYWGHLIYADYFDTSHLNNELFDIFSNPLDWKERYIHKDYEKSLEPGAKIEEPCPDVFWFPIVTDTFCDEFVAEFENYGEWSGGKNDDPRLPGGYENVPTDDIHMNQVGLEQQWLKFLDSYIRPLQKKVYDGYDHGPPQASMNFIVRYQPDKQPLLRPHQDESTYTINIALNTPGVDFQGGGCRFIRYNCSITSPRKGWLFMHPGKLTHHHEGLRTTAGTRYIMISFVDP